MTTAIFYIPKNIHNLLKNLAPKHNKTMSRIVTEAVIEYFNKYGYGMGEVTINVIQPTYYQVNKYINVVNKAEAYEAKTELQRLIKVIQKIEDKQQKTNMLVELAKCVQKAFKALEKTQDPELEALIKTSEGFFT
jgi:predicted DNA-binding protein